LKSNSLTGLILFLTVFVDMMGFSILFPLFPKLLNHYIQKPDDPVLSIILSIVHFLGNPDGKYSIVLFGGILGGIYSVLQFLFSPIWGKLSDSVGRKPVLVFTSFGTLFGYVVWLFSGSFSLFVLSRVITGVMGGNISVASAAMADNTTEANRAKGMGMIGAGIGLGFVFGPPISGLLSSTEIGSSFTIFSASTLLAVGLSLINLLLVLFFFQETLQEKGKSERTGFHPILRLNQTSVKELPLLSWVYFLFTLAFSGFEFCINFYLDQVYSFDPKQIGYTFVYIGFWIILVQGGIVRRISGKVSEKKMTLLGSGLLLFGMILISLYDSVYLTFFSLFFISTGSAFMHPGLSSLVSLFSPKTEQGKNLGILRGFGALSRAISPFLFSFLYFQTNASYTFLSSAVILLLVAVLVMKIRDPQYSNS
jgi:MFS family permease